MSVLDRFESAFERMVEGSVGKVFRAPVQPAEIGRRLERAMASGEMISVGRRLAPNAYVVEMNPADLALFADFLPALERQMADWLEGVARERGRQTIDRVRVEIVPGERTPRREIRVRASYAEWPERADGARGRSEHAAPRKLRVLNGEQRGQELLLRGASVTIGRAPDNDIVLPAEGVSRHHARIELDAFTARVVDLMSTNGTRVNGRPVVSASIAAGDDIEFGSVLVRVVP
ncbi:MAG: FhaA domain-containing protein [Thermomicrobiales bacterium]